MRCLTGTWIEPCSNDFGAGDFAEVNGQCAFSREITQRKRRAGRGAHGERARANIATMQSRGKSLMADGLE